MAVKNLIQYKLGEYPEPPGHDDARSCCGVVGKGWHCTINADIEHAVHEASTGVHICATWEGSDDYANA